MDTITLDIQNKNEALDFLIQEIRIIKIQNPQINNIVTNNKVVSGFENLSHESIKTHFIPSDTTDNKTIIRKFLLDDIEISLDTQMVYEDVRLIFNECDNIILEMNINDMYNNLGSKG
jgi:hypothetical protein